MKLIIHTCKHAGNKKYNEPYICALTHTNCKNQYYCTKEHYWKPAVKITCPQYINKENEAQDSSIKEQENK